MTVLKKIDQLEVLLHIKHLPGRHNQKLHAPLKYVAGNVTVQYAAGAKEAMQKLGLSENDLIRMHGIKGLDSEVRVTSYSGDVTVAVESMHPESGKLVGSYIRSYGMEANGDKVAHNRSFVIMGSSQMAGYGSTLYANQIMTLQERGFHSVKLNANSSVGRYAWARKGFDYANPTYELPRRNNEFSSWATEQGLAHVIDWPAFASPKEFADFDPGIRIPRSAISVGTDVKGDDFPVGKAFMLDDNGHGHWDAELLLQ